jgi:hypothetical protein
MVIGAVLAAAYLAALVARLLGIMPPGFGNVIYWLLSA